MFEALDYWITVVELPNYEADVAELLTPDECDGLITFLARHPDEGECIADTDGLRRLMWGGRGRGNTGGAQVFYYFRDLNMPVYLVAAFPPSPRVKLTKAEKSQIRETIRLIVESQWKNQVSPLVGQILKSG